MLLIAYLNSQSSSIFHCWSASFYNNALVVLKLEMSFLNSGTPGFCMSDLRSLLFVTNCLDNSPVTKVVIALTVTINVIGALIGSRKGGSKTFGYGPSSNELLLFTNWWRFITGPLVFTSVGELFFGTICLYVFRLFERQWGSHKYAVRFF